MKNINWGIIGCGGIAAKFATGLASLEDATLLAVGSRTPGKAKAFAHTYNVSTSYDCYEDLLADDRVDVVYVATTHNFHYQNVLQCLLAGKHVLCEKVFTINAKQAHHLQQVAIEKKLFLMEAMWTRFLPATKEIMKVIADGVIGEVKFMEADFSFKTAMDPEGRFYNRALAGGSLMDLGIYTVSYASMLFGRQPATIKTNACMTPTGVDERNTHIFEYPDGKAALLTSSFAYYARTQALIAGTKGHIEVPAFFHAQTFMVKAGDKTIHYELPFESNGMGYEAMEVMDCIRTGRLQSDIMSMDETVAIMETMDAIRKEYRLVYPEHMERIITS